MLSLVLGDLGGFDDGMGVRVMMKIGGCCVGARRELG